MEACDDGNTDNNDGCTTQCTVEAGFSCDLAFQGTSFRNEDFSTPTSTVKPSWTHHADGFGSTQATNTAQPSVGLFGIQALGLGPDAPYVFEISTSTADDDFIGFVIGYNAGDGTTPANHPNYFVFDWKGANQQFTSPNWVSYAGTRLLWVQGVPDNTKD